MQHSASHVIRKPRSVLLFLLVALGSGCGTIMNNNWGEGGDSRPYGGIVLDYRLGTCNQIGCGPWWFLDMPFSLAGDTALLPLDLYYYHQIKQNENPRTNQPPQTP